MYTWLSSWFLYATERVDTVFCSQFLSVAIILHKEKEMMNVPTVITPECSAVWEPIPTQHCWLIMRDNFHSVVVLWWRKLVPVGERVLCAVYLRKRIGDMVCFIFSQIFITRPGEILTRPGKIVTRPGEISTRLGKILTCPGEILTRSGEILTRLGKILTRPGEILTRPGKILTCPGEIGY